MAVLALEISSAVRVRSETRELRVPAVPNYTMHLVLAASDSGPCFILLFSGFFRRPVQFFDSLKSYVESAGRAGGAAMQTPWWYFRAHLGAAQMPTGLSAANGRS